jgi:hypothetical protein
VAAVTRRRALLAGLLVAAAMTHAGGASSTWSSWTATTGSPAGTISAAADSQAPVVSASAVGKSAGGSTGYLRQGGTYYLYASVTDAGNPPSGTNTVTANVSSISTGQTAVPLSAGSFTAQGVSYNRRSALLTANAVVAAASYATTVAVSDVAGNSAVAGGPEVVVDNTSPVGNSVQTVNGGAIRGRPDAADVITLGWSEVLDPASVLSGWSAAATPVQVVILDGGSGNDTLYVRTTTGTTLPLGTIDLNNDYVGSTTTFNATMVQSATSIAVTLGALVSGSPRTDTSKAAVAWSTGAIAGATDRAGNALLPTVVNESGTSDDDF